MIIKYYGFAKKYIGKETLSEDIVLPSLQICGYEIFDENEELKRACFQGRIVHILELLDKDNSIMNVFPEKTQSHYRDLANKIYKQEGIDNFIINVRDNQVSFQPLIPCEETATYRTPEELQTIFKQTIQELKEERNRKM